MTELEERIVEEFVDTLSRLMALARLFEPYKPVADMDLVQSLLSIAFGVFRHGREDIAERGSVIYVKEVRDELSKALEKRRRRDSCVRTDILKQVPK
jgi:hypothetical protein